MLKNTIIKVLQKPPLWFQLLILIIYIAFISTPFIVVRVIYRVPKETEVNPTIVNGLLTASSILFGFMIVLIPWQERWFGGWLWILPLVSVSMLLMAANDMFLSGIDPTRQLNALESAMASFEANIVSLPILIAIREIMRRRQ
jgi:uncharacterized membrane protein